MKRYRFAALNDRSIAGAEGDPKGEYVRYEDVKEMVEYVERLKAMVNNQAEDPGIWFVAETISEGYLQQALRSLHAAIEGKDLSWMKIPEVEECN